MNGEIYSQDWPGELCWFCEKPVYKENLTMVQIQEDGAVVNTCWCQGCVQNIEAEALEQILEN